MLSGTPDTLGFGWFVLAVAAYLFVQRYGLIALGYAFARTSFATNRRVYRLDVTKKQWTQELRQSHWPVLFDSLAFAALVYSGLLRLSPVTSIVSVVLFFFCHFVWFELYFYATHRAMHTKMLYWIHRPHHVAHITHPITAASFGFFERVILFVGFFIPFVVMSQLGVDVSLATILVCIAVNDVFNVMGHLNVDFYPKMYSTTLVNKLVNCPTTHALHHARLIGHYGQITPWFDKLFGTEFPDHLAVSDRAREGQGLGKLSARISSNLGQEVGTSEGIEKESQRQVA